MTDNRYRIEAVYQAGKVLEAVANSKEPICAAEIAKTIGVTANMAFRQCSTLEELGLLRTVGDKKYVLGMKLALYWARTKSRLEGERDSITRNLEELNEESEV